MPSSSMRSDHDGGVGDGIARHDGRTRGDRSDDCRGQTDPLVALVALFAVSVGVSLYAGVLDDVSATVGVDRDVATPTLERVHEATTTAGVLDPSSLEDARSVAPDGYESNVSVRAAAREWEAGPPTPTATSSEERVDSAARSVGVRLGPGRVRPGRLRVVVWS